MFSRNSDSCPCDCHRSKDDIVHVVACCLKCPYCSLNISRYAYDKHLNNCPCNKNKRSSRYNKA